jgi:hypothetical protein
LLILIYTDEVLAVSIATYVGRAGDIVRGYVVVAKGPPGRGLTIGARPFFRRR